MNNNKWTEVKRPICKGEKKFLYGTEEKTIGQVSTICGIYYAVTGPIKSSMRGNYFSPKIDKDCSTLEEAKRFVEENIPVTKRGRNNE